MNSYKEDLLTELQTFADKCDYVVPDTIRTDYGTCTYVFNNLDTFATDIDMYFRRAERAGLQLHNLHTDILQHSESSLLCVTNIVNSITSTRKKLFLAGKDAWNNNTLGWVPGYEEYRDILEARCKSLECTFIRASKAFFSNTKSMIELYFYRQEELEKSREELRKRNEELEEEINKMNEELDEELRKRNEELDKEAARSRKKWLKRRGDAIVRVLQENASSTNHVRELSERCAYIMNYFGDVPAVKWHVDIGCTKEDMEKILEDIWLIGSLYQRSVTLENNTIIFEQTDAYNDSGESPHEDSSLRNTLHIWRRVARNRGCEQSEQREQRDEQRDEERSEQRDERSEERSEEREEREEREGKRQGYFRVQLLKLWGIMYVLLTRMKQMGLNYSVTHVQHLLWMT